nr:MULTISPECIES: PQQ-binding-like beta-propeller repeat protein [Brevibacterium]
MMLVLLAGLTACTDDSGDPLEYADPPVWKGKDFGALDLSGTRIIGDTALISTTVHSGGGLAAIDLRSGEVLWSADDGDPVLDGDGAVVDLRSPHEPAPPLVRDLGDGGFEVLVPYRTAVDSFAVESGSTHDVGVMALNGETGKPSWVSEPLSQAKDNGVGNLSELRARPMFADADTVVAVATSGDHPQSLVTSALDADSGDTRWSVPELWPTSLGGGTVTLTEVDELFLFHDDSGPEPRETASVSAVRAADGKPAWDLDKDFDASRLVAASGGYAVISGETEDEADYPVQERRLVRLDSGATVEELAGFASCVSSSVLIACTEEDELTTYRTDGEGELVTRESRPFGSKSSSHDWEISEVFGENLVAVDGSEGTEVRSVLDAEGRTRADELPGFPKELTEEYGVFCAEETEGCTISAAAPEKVTPGSASSSVEPWDLGEPLWTWGGPGAPGSKLPLDSSSGAAVVDDAVVSFGEGDSPSTYVVAEAQTGKVRWTLESRTPGRTPGGAPIEWSMYGSGEPHIVDTAEGWSLLTTGISESRMGIVSLSGDSGEVEWFQPLTAAEDVVRIRTVAGARVGATIEEYSDDDANSQGSTRTVLLDTSAGKDERTVWTLDDATVVSIAEETVLVRATENSGGYAQEGGHRLVGIDDGKDVRFETGGGASGDGDGDGDGVESEVGDELLHPAAIAGDLLIVNTDDGAEIRDVTSGSLLERVGKRLTDCAASAGTVMCSSAPQPPLNRLATPIVLSRDGDSIAVDQLRDHGIAGISGAHDGRFFVHSQDVNQSIAIDEKGHLVDPNVPGGFAGVSSQGYVLLMTCQPGACTWEASWDVRRSG